MADDDDDDYMTMTFGEEDAGKRKKESSLQRRMRLQRLGRERGHVPSKAELARTAEQEREAALSRSLIPERSTSMAAGASVVTAAKPAPVSKGLAMMARMGFVAGQALGKKREVTGGEGGDGGDGGDGGNRASEAVTEPIRIHVKRDRGGIGLGADGGPASKKARGDDQAKSDDQSDHRDTRDEVDPLAYRDRIRQERETARLERQVHAAQVLAERMEEDEGDGSSSSSSSKKLSEINVLWRGLVREQRLAEDERQAMQRQRQRLDEGLRGRRRFGVGGGDDGPENDDDDDDDDNDDRMAAGKAPASSFLAAGMRTTEVGDDDDEGDDDPDEDTELAAFAALPPRDRLQQIVDWLRTNRRYCFWCKHTYADASLDGCPGATEEDHD